MVKRILISRTDSLSDVILTLPMLGILKELDTECVVIFLGNSDTKYIVECCEFVDEVIAWDDYKGKSQKEKIDFFQALNADVIIHVFPDIEIATLAKKAGIPDRIGTNRRPYHWFTCNKLVNLRRKNSLLHEAQLNLKLLKPFGLKRIHGLNELHAYGIKCNVIKESKLNVIDNSRFNLVVQVTEEDIDQNWGLDNLKKLIRQIPQSHYNIIIIGSKVVYEVIDVELIKPYKGIVKGVVGDFSMKELICLVSAADGFIGTNSGFLHLAAALEKKTIGIFAPVRPAFPRAWAPIGINSDYLVLDKKCSACRVNKNCECIKSISPHQVLEKLLE